MRYRVHCHGSSDEDLDASLPLLATDRIARLGSSNGLKGRVREANVRKFDSVEARNCTANVLVVLHTCDRRSTPTCLQASTRF